MPKKEEEKALIPKKKVAKKTTLKSKDSKTKASKAKETKTKVSKVKETVIVDKLAEKTHKKDDKNLKDIKPSDSAKTSDQTEKKVNLKDFDWHNFEEGIEEVNEKQIKEFEKLVQ